MWNRYQPGRLSPWTIVFLLASLMAKAAFAITIDWVSVGDPGNAADTINTGTNPNYGSVGHRFEIMKFEWTNLQYVQFLNSVDPEGTNPNSIYSPAMGSASNRSGGISFTSGNSPGTKYALRNDMGDKPVNYVSWFDAARVTNWLQAGGLVYATSASGSAAINSGAYTLSGSTSGGAPARNAQARYWIPTEDEWYKAAYYRGSGTSAGYWQYATQITGAPPIAVAATAVGTGSSAGVSPVTIGNSINYDLSANWNNSLNGNVTTVGSNGGASAYGAFDLSGNVFEWNDRTGAAASSRGLRGGGFLGSAFQASSSWRNTPAPSLEEDYLGFRLATQAGAPSVVPEVDASGWHLVVAIVTGSLALRDHRRTWKGDRAGSDTNVRRNRAGSSRDGACWRSVGGSP